MRREQDRLDSFHSWTLSIITPAELAKAGFYYLGQADRVACFSCGGQVRFIIVEGAQPLSGSKSLTSLAEECSHVPARRVQSYSKDAHFRIVCQGVIFFEKWT